MFIIPLLVIVLVIAGCSPTAKKPAEPMLPATPAPQNASPDPMMKVSINPISPMEITIKAVAEAGKVRGVQEAFGFVTDKVLYIGLDLKDNSGNLKSIDIEKNVINQINSINSGYVVRVTSDQDTVKLIKTVAQGIAQGLPMSDFSNEVHNVTVKMTPKGSMLFNWKLKVFHIFKN